jgi:hypothetical protein
LKSQIREILSWKPTRSLATPTSDRAAMARYGAYLFAAGGTLAVVLTFLPDSGAENRPAILLVALLAYLCAALLLVGFDRMPPPPPRS